MNSFGFFINTIISGFLKTRNMTNHSHEISQLDTSAYHLLLDSLGASSSFMAFFTALMTPYTNPLGSLFFIFLYVVPLAVIWVRQDKALIPVGLMVIFGVVLSGALPPSWILPAQIIMFVTTIGIIKGLIKERG